MKAEAGDKVRIKVGPHSGERGFVKDIDGENYLVQMEKSGFSVRVQAKQITNYSLAARKAWVTGPDRAVGRRKGTKVRDRVTVAFRLDREIWESFLSMESAGLIEDRNGVVNEWMRQKLSEIRGKDRCPKK